jgi:hypothetical protein
MMAAATISTTAIAKITVHAASCKVAPTTDEVRTYLRRPLGCD